MVKWLRFTPYQVFSIAAPKFLAQRLGKIPTPAGHGFCIGRSFHGLFGFQSYAQSNSDASGQALKPVSWLPVNRRKYQGKRWGHNPTQALFFYMNRLCPACPIQVYYPIKLPFGMDRSRTAFIIHKYGSNIVHF